MEILEDRFAPAILTESGATLTITLDNFDESLEVASAGATYLLNSTHAFVDGGISPGRVSAAGTSAILEAGGLAAYDTIRIVDGIGIQGTRVIFKDSGANAYSDHFLVSLTEDHDVAAGEESVLFSGHSAFGAFDLSVSTTRNIVVGSGAGISASGGEIALVANSARTTTGMFPGVSIGAGGQILGGASGQAVTLDGTGGLDGVSNYGVFISGAGALITSSGGAVVVTGHGGGSGSSHSNHGVYLVTGAQIRAGGSGATVVNGTGGQSGGGGVLSAFNLGVYIEGSGSEITSTDGAVQVTGVGGGLTGEDARGTNRGVFVSFSAQISAGGNGTVTVHGTGGVSNSGGANFGVMVSGRITSTGGPVEVVGRGGTSFNTGTALPSGQNYGVNVAGGGQIHAGNTGSVTVLGLGGQSSGSGNSGIIVNGGSSSAIITSAGGNVRVTGQAGSGLLTGQAGITVGPGGLITAAGTGTVTVEGTGGPGHNMNHGVSIGATFGNATITSGGGAVQVTGQAGGGPGGTNVGVALGTNGRILAGGSGTVTVHGTGGDGNGSVNSSENFGVHVQGAGATISSGSGAVQVTGQGGIPPFGASNYGVYVVSAGRITAGGSATVTVQGTGGSSADGVRVENTGSAITSTGGPVSVIGRGGSAGGPGVHILSAALVAAGGAGTLFIDGIGGDTGGNNHGVAVFATISSSGGPVVVTGRGGGSGTSINNFGVMVSTNGRITSGGTGSVTVDGIGGTGTANHGVRVEFTGATITSGGGPVQVSGAAVSTGAFGIHVGSSGAVTTATNGGAITLIGDTMNLAGTASVNGGANTVTLRPRTIFTVIDLGGADAAGILGLTDTELDKITASTLNIGAVNTNAINVVGAISRPSATNVHLRSNSHIALNPGSLNTAGGALTVTPGTSSASFQPASSGVDVTVSSVSFAPGARLRIDINGLTVDTQYWQLNVVGAVDITGVTLDLNGAAAVAVGDTFTIINNDETDPVIGNFDGLPEASIISNFLGSGLYAEISYVGGIDSNDVVLSVVADGDGVAASIENNAANGSGDGNGDGILDSVQDHVASLPNANDGGYITLQSAVGSALLGVKAVETPAGLPPDAESPLGTLDFRVVGLTPGQATTVVVIVPVGVQVNQYWKYGSTGWYDFAWDGTTGAMFSDQNGDGTNDIVLHFVDGERGDDDGAPNGVIIDPGTPILIAREPIAENQTVDTNEDSSVSGILVANDNDPVTYSIVSVPVNGTLTLDPTSGGFLYTPNPNYHGPDSFTFKANDGQFDSNIATVSITVNSVNDAPVGGGDAGTTGEDMAVTIDVLGNDTDVDAGAVLTIQSAGQSNHGMTVISDGKVVYTPNANYFGSDSFTYIVQDQFGATATATVTIVITAVNDAPVANPDTATVNEDASVLIGVLGNDSRGPANEDSQTLTVISATALHGVVAINGDGTLTYTPAANYNGPDTISYTIEDNGTTNGDANPKQSSSTVGVTVVSVNDAPVADAQSLSVNEDGSLPVMLGAADVDVDTLTYSLVSGPAHGTLSGTGANLTYTPNANYNGPDSFTFKASDGSLDSNVATVSINVLSVNDAPVANGESLSVNEDGSLSVTLGAADVDGDPLSYIVVGGPAHGTLSGSGPNLVYTPDPNYHGSDSFTFKANDGSIDSNVATVTITVNEINDAPVATGENVSVAEDGSVAGSLLDNDSDPDNLDGITGNEDTLKVVIVSAPSHGTLAVNLETGAFTYTPGAGCEAVSDSFTYHVVDSRGAVSNVVTVTITINQHAGVSTDGEGILRVGGGSGDDVITVSAGNLVVNGISHSLTSVTEIRIWGRGGNDRIDLTGTGLTSFIHASDGNDVVVGGAGDDIILGGRGNDDITGGSGNDFLIGGEGSDRIVGSAGHDILVAGDVACSVTRDALVWALLDWVSDRAQDLSTSTEEDEAVITGDSYDMLTGSSGADLFFINIGDKITDFKVQNKDGDVVVYV